MSADDDGSVGISDGDLSSTDLSDGECSAKDSVAGGNREDVSRSNRIQHGHNTPELGDAPLLLSGYSQTYIVRKQDPTKDQGRNRQVLFRCGNWCYAGEVSFAGLGDGEAIALEDIPRAVPMLQRQQDRLKFFCCADRVPLDSVYRQPVDILAEAQEFVAQELTSANISEELTKWSGVFHWIDDEASASTYFELQAELPTCMKHVALVASKTYARGLVFITVYQENSFYIVMQDGEGDQALLDIRFPDVSHHGQGLHLMHYDHPERPWRKLTLWHAIRPTPATQATSEDTGAVGGGKSGSSPASLRKFPTTDLSSERYMQTYVIMKPTGSETFGTNNAYRDVLFRFGSWCYSGTVQLTAALALADIPHVIPALRMQQSKLDFMCDVAQIPSKSPFAGPLAYMQRLMPLMEEQLADSEAVLTELLDKLADMGLEDSVASWFDGDSMQSFFEFQTAPTRETKEVFKGVDLVACKAYSARGVVTIGMWYDNTYYVVLGEGGDEQPLLDSRFPNVSTKGRGYQVKAVTEGPEGWEELRKVSVWQTAAALQQEIEAKMIKAGEKESVDAQAGGADRENGLDIDASRKPVPTELAKADAGRPANLAAARVGGRGVGAGGERASGGSGSGGGIVGDLAVLAGGDGAEAQPKDSQVSGPSGSEMVSTTSGGGGEGEGRRVDGDRQDRGSGSKDTKRLGDTESARGRGDVQGGSKYGGGDDSVPSTSAGAKIVGSPLTGLERHAAAKALTNTKVALPHHLAPMAGLQDKLRKMRVEMESQRGDGDAPWDAFGRPRTAALGGAKSHK